jgi:hypothetical protein
MSEEAEPEEHKHANSKRWLLVSVIVPIAVALISATTVAIEHWIRSAKESQTASSATVLPPSDPIPAAWCFDCNPNLIAIARDCRDGSMHACDDLWNTVADPTVAEPGAIRDYGISCGGRRQLRSPGYQYKDCTDEFPGHN